MDGYSCPFDHISSSVLVFLPPQSLLLSSSLLPLSLLFISTPLKSIQIQANVKEKNKRAANAYFHNVISPLIHATLKLLLP